VAGMAEKALVTEADVQDALKQGAQRIQVAKNVIVTPLAATTIKDNGIILEVLDVASKSSRGANGAVVHADPNIRGKKMDLLGLDLQKLLDMYATMWRIRAFEQAVGVLFREQRLIGFLHLSIGQEAIPTGASAALNPDDYLTLTHRGHGQMVARGSDINRMMAELLGRVTGYCRGKGGSVHLADFANGILGANGIVAAGTVIATGAAMSAKMRGSKQVALAFFGDGAVNHGTFHEALNYASYAKLPVIYVCENNQYAVSMAAREATTGGSIAARGSAYGMPSFQIDGQNVLEVYDRVLEAASHARRGDGPTLIECLTYRFHGHWEGETLELRPEEEQKLWRKRDPIDQLERALLANKLVTEEHLTSIYSSVVEEIADAVRYAEQSPFPAEEEAIEHVLAT
jgi:acetoin:2,6-dichlorophenolindophenol oxidoreductase subunit alpha